MKQNVKDAKMRLVKAGIEAGTIKMVCDRDDFTIVEAGGHHYYLDSGPIVIEVKPTEMIFAGYRNLTLADKVVAETQRRSKQWLTTVCDNDANGVKYTLYNTVRCFLPADMAC